MDRFMYDIPFFFAVCLTGAQITDGGAKAKICFVVYNLIYLPVMFYMFFGRFKYCADAAEAEKGRKQPNNIQSGKESR